MPYLMQFADHSLVAVGWFPVLFSLVGKTGKKERERKKNRQHSFFWSTPNFYCKVRWCVLIKNYEIDYNQKQVSPRAIRQQTHQRFHKSNEFIANGQFFFLHELIIFLVFWDSIHTRLFNFSFASLYTVQGRNEKLGDEMQIAINKNACNWKLCQH